MVRNAFRAHAYEHTSPADWFESLVKAYVGDGLANDFYREIAAFLDADTRDLVVASLDSGGQAAQVAVVGHLARVELARGLDVVVQRPGVEPDAAARQLSTG